MAKRVVIIGVGFGGLNAARVLANQREVDVTLIDRHNYHLFQPLLYQVATASIEQEAIAYPVRSIIQGWRNTRFHLGDVKRIDLKKKVVINDTGPIPYDILIVGAGAVSGFFGIKGIEKHSYQLKTLPDAVILRNHILTLFEQASREADPAKKAALLTFVTVGGGPTGIEFCGALAELVRQVMRKDYPEIHPEEVKSILLEATEDLLPMVPKPLRGYAIRRLESMGVEVRLGAKVTGMTGTSVSLADGSRIEAHTLHWAAGIQAAPLAAALKSEAGKSGRLLVGPDLTLPGHPDVYIIGDMAYVEQDGVPLRGTESDVGVRASVRQALPTMAPVAIQEGAYAGRAILARERGEQPAPFHYKDMGAMAVIGRGAAVARVFGADLSGVLAWFAWLGFHLISLIGFRNRLVVLVNWAYDYLFFDRKIRLITWTRK